MKVSMYTVCPVNLSLICSQNPLEFELRLQEFIELARARSLMDAITYQKKHLIQWQETHSTQINQASALLAYTPATAFGPYKVS